MKVAITVASCASGSAVGGAFSMAALGASWPTVLAVGVTVTALVSVGLLRFYPR